MSLFYRIIDLIKNEITHQWDQQKNQQEKFNNDNYFDHDSKESKNNYQSKNPPPNPLEKELALFEISHPVNLNKLKEKRNRIFKKYHPDRFNNNLEKQKIAKEMIQTYNVAYERIYNYYK